jgi:hypothetical protein
MTSKHFPTKMKKISSKKRCQKGQLPVQFLR